MDEDIIRSISRDADGGVTMIEGERTLRLPPPVPDEAMFAAADAFFGAEG
jgi:hypothetical protein